MKKIIRSFIVVFVLFFVACNIIAQDTTIKELEGLFSEINRDSVTDNLNFPSKINNVSLTWESSKPEIISEKGIVTRTDKEEVVRIKATWNFNNEAKNVEFVFIVSPKEIDLNQVMLDSVKSQLVNNVDLTKVSSDLELITSIENVNIQWKSSNESVISPSGKVNQGLEETKVTLTATLTIGNLKEELTYEVTVLANNHKEIVNSAIQSLFKDVDLNNYEGKTIDLVTNVKVAEETVSIKWNSNNEEVISESGNVTQTDKDVTVTLVATLTYKDYSVEKEFTVIVKGIKEATELADYVKNTNNFKLIYDVKYDDGGWTTNYYYTNNYLCMEYEYENEFYKYYIETVDGINYLIYESEGIVYRFGENDSEFEDEYYYASFDEWHIDAIDYKDYKLVDGYYVPLEGKLQKASKDIFGDYDYSDEVDTITEVFSSLSIKVENGLIVQINAESVYSGTEYEEPFKYNYVYELKLSNFGTIVASLPVDNSKDKEELENVKKTLLSSYDLTKVSSNLELATTIGNVSVVWTSSNNEVLSNTGVVKQSLENKNVVLTASLKIGNLTEEVKFNITVLGTSEDITVKSAINEVLSDYNLSAFYGDKIALLSTIEVNEKIVTIKWESNNTEVISNSGEVTHQSTDSTVILKGTFTCGNYTEEKEFSICVKATSSENELEEALKNITNFKVIYEVKYADGGWESVYYYTKDGLCMEYEYEGETYQYYVVVIEGVEYLIYEYDGIVYTYSENDQEYEDEYYYASFDSLYLEDIDFNDYTFKDGYYIPLEGKLQKAAKDIFDDYDYSDETSNAKEVFSSLSIKVEDGFIKQINAQSLYSGFDGEEFSYDYTYKLDFSDFGKVSITPPESSSTDTIADIYDKEGQIVTIEGVITGVVGNNFYVSDGQNAIYIYCGSNTSFASLVETGNAVVVTGTVSYYKGLCEITNPTISTSGKEFNSVTIELTELLNLEENKYNKVNIKGLTLVNLTQYESGKDIKAIVSLNNVQTNLFVSRFVSNYNDIYSQLSGLKQGDVFNLNNAIIGCFNTYQLEITSDSVISKGEEVVVYKLELSSYRYIALVNTDVTDVLNNLKVYLVSSNDDKTELTKEQYQITNDYDIEKVGIYNLVITYEELSETFVLVVKEVVEESEYTILDDVAISNNVSRGLPSTGDVDILVIPVEFSDKKAPADAKENIEKAFFGTTEQTGWHSLTTYYQESSYGKLNISGTVLDVFNTGKTTRYYENMYDNNQDADYTIIKAALQYYDNTVDYSLYDSNKDGYIDCLYFVYMADVSYSEGSDLWWAYTYEYFTEDYEYYDGLETDYYVFSGYDFINEAYRSDNAKDEYIEINSATFIHETGHALGLDDYYDYEESKGPKGGIGGSDMMDSTVGDHNPFSKAILGWTTPTVVNTSQTITLKSFGLTGESIIIAKDWQDSLFTEYYIIDFYTPDGLNELHKGYSGLFDISGIRIYHIDAQLNTSTVSPIEDIFTIYKYNNTDTSHKLISLVEADGLNDIEDNDYSSNSDLFTEGTTFSNAKWYDNTSANFTLTVNTISEDEASITIVINNK